MRAEPGLSQRLHVVNVLSHLAMSEHIADHDGAPASFERDHCLNLLGHQVFEELLMGRVRVGVFLVVVVPHGSDQVEEVACLIDVVIALWQRLDLDLDRLLGQRALNLLELEAISREDALILADKV